MKNMAEKPPPPAPLDTPKLIDGLIPPKYNLILHEVRFFVHQCILFFFLHVC